MRWLYRVSSSLTPLIFLGSALFAGFILACVDEGRWKIQGLSRKMAHGSKCGSAKLIITSATLGKANSNSIQFHSAHASFRLHRCRKSPFARQLEREETSQTILTLSLSCARQPSHILTLSLRQIFGGMTDVDMVVNGSGSSDWAAKCTFPASRLAAEEAEAFRVPSLGCGVAGSRDSGELVRF